MAKKKSKQSPHLKVFAVILVILIIAAFGVFRYIQTEAGRVFLLDIGFDSRFDRVQKELEIRITRALVRAGVPRDRIKVETEDRTGVPHTIAVLRIATLPDASLLQVNNEIDKAVTAGGARVRSCREARGGRSITMEIGTRRVTTHRCIIRKGRVSKRIPEITDGEPVVALLVDDFGYFNNRLVRDFLAVEVPLTISVIPGLRYSEAICEDAAKAGKEVLCHLPMEPERGGWDSGDIPLVRVSMGDGEIEEIIENALDTTPGVIGMNNHMGSRATADRRVMEAVLDVCRRRELFFIDSMTTSRSVVREVSRKKNVRSLSNDLFIDNTDEETRENMRKILSLASRRGRALGIVHVKRKTLKDLHWMIDEANREGIHFITVSEMIEKYASK